MCIFLPHLQSSWLILDKDLSYQHQRTYNKKFPEKTPKNAPTDMTHFVSSQSNIQIVEMKSNSLIETGTCISLLFPTEPSLMSVLLRRSIRHKVACESSWAPWSQCTAGLRSETQLLNGEGKRRGVAPPRRLESRSPRRPSLRWMELGMSQFVIAWLRSRVIAPPRDRRLPRDHRLTATIMQHASIAIRLFNYADVWFAWPRRFCLIYSESFCGCRLVCAAPAICVRKMWPVCWHYGCCAAQMGLVKKTAAWARASDEMWPGQRAASGRSSSTGRDSFLWIKFSGA